MWTLIVLLFVSCCLGDDDFSGDAYQHQSRFAKRGLLWKDVQDNQEPLGYYNTLQTAELFVESMDLSFDTVADSMPQQYIGEFFERKKLIHTVGVHALATFNIVNKSHYTGLFSSGCDAAIIRFSLATEAKSEMGEGAFVPGIAIKFLRDNVPAGNVFAMYSLAGQEDYNFFSHDFTNHVPFPGSWMGTAQKALLNKFLTASEWPTMIGLSDLARWDQTGQESTTPRFPYRLVFHPNDRYHTGFPTGWTDTPFYKQLMTGLETGHVYDVYAQDQPLQDNNQLFKIGEITLTSVGVTSYFGDRHMFLQHTKFEDDLSFQPQWEELAKQEVDTEKSYPRPGFLRDDLPFRE